MSTLQIRLFGDFEIRLRDQPLPGFESPRMRSLLTYLLLHRDAPQSRKHLAFLLWQDSAEHQAHGNLRNLVHRLRSALPDSGRFLAVDTLTLQWRADSPFTLDLDEFQNAAEQTDSVSALQTAVDLYCGDLLPACQDEWLVPERERLRTMLVDALAQLVVLTEGTHEYQAAIGYARRLLQTDPLSEEGYRKLMELYALTGDRANVVRVYQTCVAVLKRELNAEPGAATREMYERLRRREAPVLRAVSPRRVKSNLPLPLTSFVGRAQELDEIQSLLHRTRLVTLTGVGGGGKTRLAVQAGHAIADKYPDGAWFVDLAPLSDPADIPSTCAAVLGLQEQATRSAVQLLADSMRDKELLLVLDNCEHLLGACAPFAQMVLQGAPRVRILATSREPLNVSGEALLVVPPLSLPPPHSETLETLSHSDAVQLFVARASFSLPTFSLNRGNVHAVAQICRRLDGIPLAIELAAARIRTLSPRQIVTRLDDALAVLTRGSPGMPARHQTMRAVLDWSDALLSEPERILFRRLAVFAGGFTLDAAEQVCTGDGGMERKRDREIEGAGEREKNALHYSITLSLHPSLPPPLILDLLSNLIDKSLVMVEETDDGMRYRMLEPIREYARIKLLDGVGMSAESEMMTARHLDFFTQLAEQAEPELTGPQQAYWIKRLEAEHDNVRAALSAKGGEPEYTEQQLRLAGALWRFWYARGYIVQGKHFLQTALQQGQETAPAVRAKGYVGLGTMAWLHGEYEQAIRLHEQALALYRQVQDTHGIALSLCNIGGAYIEQWQYDRAETVLQESLMLARGLGDHLLLTLILMTIGELARYRGDYDRAQDLYEQAHAAASEIRHIQHISLALSNMGLVATRRGDFTRAVRLHRESLALYQSGREVRFVPECLEGLAAALAGLGDYALPAVLLGAADALRTSIALSVQPLDRQDYERVLAQVREKLQSQFESAWNRGHAMTMEQAIALALEAN